MDIRTPARPPRRPSPSPAAALGREVLFVHLVLSPLVFSSETLDTFEFNKVALLQLTVLVLAALGLSSLLRQWAAGGMCFAAALRRLRRDPVALAVGLLLASAGLSTLTSLSPRTSFFGAHASYAGFLTFLAYAGLFAATRWACPSAEDGRRLLSAAVLAGGLVSAFALVQWAGFDPYPWAGVSQVGSYRRPAATLGHANLLAGYLVLALPVSVAFAAAAARKRQWYCLGAFGLVALMSFLAVVVSLSRGAWLALAVMALMTAGVGVRRLPRPAAFRLLVGGGAVLGLGLSALALSPGGAGRERLQGLADLGGRAHIWRAGLAVWADHPWLGCGPDAFALAFAKHRTADYWHTEWGVTPARAHNELIHALATQGVLGGGALLALLGGLSAAARRAWKQAPAEARPFVGALAVGLGGFTVQSLVSFTMAGCGTLLVTCAALLCRRAEAEADREDTAPCGRWGLPLALMAAGAAAALVLVAGLPPPGGPTAEPAVLLSTLGLVFALVAAALVRGEGPVAASTLRVPRPAGAPAWVRCLQAGVWAGAALAALALVARPYQAGVAAGRAERLLATDPAKALEYAEEAVALDPAQEVYWTRLGGAGQAVAEAGAAPDEQRRLLLRARRAFETAAELVPANAYNHANLGAVLRALAEAGAADPGEVFRAYAAALARDPANAYFLRDAATAEIALGDPDRARRHLSEGLTLYPEYGPFHAEMGYLNAAAGRPAEALPFLRRAFATPDLDGNGAAWLAVGATLAATLEQLHRFDEALPVARAVVAREPRWTSSRLVLAEVLDRLGRRAEALAEYEEVIRGDPAATPAAVARQRLLQLGAARPGSRRDDARGANPCGARLCPQ